MNYELYLDMKAMRILYNTEDIIFFDDYSLLKELMREKGLTSKTLPKGYIRGASKVIAKCSFCEESFEWDFEKLRNFTKTKYGNDKVTCTKDECVVNKKRYVIQIQTSLGETSAQGHIVSDEQKTKWLKVMRDRGHYAKFSETRKGKSYEDLYGEETANVIKKKISEYRVEHQTGDNEPHLGYKHSEESKKVMSNSRKLFLKSDRVYKKKYCSPITGKKVNWIEFRSHTSKHFFESMTIEEREIWLGNVTKSFLDKDGNFDGVHDQGYVHNWYSKKKEKYDSSYEKRYYSILNEKKSYWTNNRSITIPYISPKDNLSHRYIPDVIIYTDNTYSKIDRLIEVKPLVFLQESDRLYNKITRAKLEALKVYCNKRFIEFGIITEKELEEYENKKNYKERTTF